MLEFQDSLKPALAAIDKKDSQALFEAGDRSTELRELPSGVLVSERWGIGVRRASASAR